MAPLSRELLVRCFVDKLHGKVAKATEHIHYAFWLDGRMVAKTHVSPPNKYPNFGDDILAKIAHPLGVGAGVLRRCAQCNTEATQQILTLWRQRLINYSNS